MKNIAILGSTGSIGTQALDIVRMNPERYKIVALTCRSSVDLLSRQIEEFKPEIAVVENEEAAQILRDQCKTKETTVLSGMDGLIEAATAAGAHMVLTSLVGSVGLIPTLKAIEKGIDIALANKETLVTAGRLVMDAAQQHGVSILPVDSEHSAIFQALQGNSEKMVERLILTASGGPFRLLSKKEIETKKAADALKHPNWNMGAKITIDSATLMNKGLEVIEAKWLFNVAANEIDVVVHPQSIIHSMVEYKDSSIIAQMGLPDMRLPIHYAFNYPERMPLELPRLSFKEMGQLTFEEPDIDRFPCLKLAYEALKIGGTMPCVLNAANEILVEAYLKGEIGFYDIPIGIERAMNSHQPIDMYDLETLLETDTQTRNAVKMYKGGSN